MIIDNLINRIDNLGINTFAGVPDSLLQPLSDYLNSKDNTKFKHVVCANEGNAIGYAAGVYLASKKPAVVYMQNSGLGNCVNPIASLTNEHVYDIPLLLVIGLRGECGVKDEPQHKFQGMITCETLDLLNIKNVVIDKDSLSDFNSIFTTIKNTLEANKPFAIVVKKDTFDKRNKSNLENSYTYIREDAIRSLVKNIDENDFIVSTTGKISRELYEVSRELKKNEYNNFLTVGSMGHASSIALGIASNSDKRIICLDGDGAMLMHMGALAVNYNYTANNLIHIVLNNEAHESVGGMPTGASGFKASKIAKAIGYKNVYKASNEAEFVNALHEAFKTKELSFIEVFVKNGARSDLGRPKETPIENKINFMERLCK